MVMVVADPILETRRRSRRLNPPDDALREQEGQRVVDGLEGDRANVGANRLDDGVCGDMRMTGDCSQYRQTLRRDLDAVPAEEADCVRAHSGLSYQILE
jgi:hypothetical protein